MSNSETDKHDGDLTPPKTRYELKLRIHGNSHEELMSEVLSITRGGYLLATDHYQRDEVTSYGGSNTIELIHTNPGQTKEKYEEELETWFETTKARRRENERRIAEATDGSSDS